MILKSSLDVDRHYRQLVIMKKILGNKLNKGKLQKAQSYEKLLKIIKKEIKEQKLDDIQTSSFFLSTFQSIENFVRQAYYQFRLPLTDFEAMIMKKKHLENHLMETNYLKRIQELEKSQKRWMEELILISKQDNALFSSKDQLRFCSLQILMKKALNLLEKTKFVQGRKISSNQLKKIISKAVNHYNIAPYHNFTHAVCVMVSFAQIVQVKGLSAYINDFEMFFGLICCLFHDIQHDCLTTLFYVKIKSQLAITYGNNSVLERMHLSKTMEILQRNEETNFIFKSLNQEQAKKARRIVSECIMGTDMSRHYDMHKMLKEKQFSPNKEDSHQFLLAALVHACDIDNPTMQFGSYIFWANMICLEFNDQTIKEEQYKIEVTEYLKFNSLPYFYKNQLTFANNVVYPFWQTLCEKFPSIQKQKQYLKKINKNITLLQEYLRKNGQENHYKSIEKYINYRLSK